MDRVARAVGDAAGADRGLRRRRRHLDRQHLGGVLPRLARRRLRRRAVRRQQVGGHRQPRPRLVRRQLPLRPRLDVLDGEVVDGPAGPAARRRRPALQRARQLARRERAELRRGRRPARGRRLRRPTRTATGSARSWSTTPTWATQALERGCADLVVGGHLHVRSGPTAVLGENGAVGYSYTTGTTGGAAYAIAVGEQSAPRRRRSRLVTYRDGRPVGVQSVMLDTDGDVHGRRLRRASTPVAPEDCTGRALGSRPGRDPRHLSRARR